jgi:hypothetical protein
VIFYDNSASEIRLIQRMGRTGRSGKGKVVFLYTKGTSDEISLWAGKRKRAQMRTKLGGTPLLPKSKKSKRPKKLKSLQAQPHAVTSSKQRYLGSSPQKFSPSKHPNVNIHVSTEKQSMYHLSDALPVKISPTTNSKCKYELAIPATDPFIGIDLVPASYISMNITNLSLFRQIARKKQAVAHYLLFVDAQTIAPSATEKFNESVKAFKKFTGIPVTVFTDLSALHLTLHNILTTYLKNNPQIKA